MMLPQIAGKLTVTDIQESVARKYDPSEEWVGRSGFSQGGSKLNLSQQSNLDSKPSARELYVQIKDGVVDQIIKHGLSRAESKLFFYLLKLDRFGDRPVKVKIAEILLGAGIGKTAYHAAIAKFEAKGWFSFTHADVGISNLCTLTKKFANASSDSANASSDSANASLDSASANPNSASANSDSASANPDSANANSNSASANLEKLKPSPRKVSKTSQTIQTYSNLLNTLSEGMRECFEKFCLKKIEECSFKIGSRTAWLNKHGAEYLNEFKEKYSDALVNPAVVAPKVESSAFVNIPTLKAWYGDAWQEAAKHHGLIPSNFSVEENDSTI